MPPCEDGHNYEFVGYIDIGGLQEIYLCKTCGDTCMIPQVLELEDTSIAEAEG